MKKILIADDEENIRESMTLALKMAGYEVKSAGDGNEALAYILKARDTAEPIDLLVTDIQMPELSGLNLIDKINEENIDLPVLAITGFGDKKMVIELLRKGCDEYIDKPLDPEKLLNRVKGVMDKYQNQVSKKGYCMVNFGETKFSVTTKDGWKTVIPSGNITESVAKQFRSLLLELLDSETAKFRFDFKNVKDIDIVGLRVMLSFGKIVRLEKKCGDLEVVNMCSDVVNLLNLTYMGDTFTIRS